MKKITQKWIAIGENELGFAKLGLNADSFYPQVCAQSHQAAEKFLKALLAEKEITFKKTHDLNWLLEKCITFNSKCKKLEDECDFLNSFYMELRYPDSYPEKNLKDAKTAVKSADKIRDFIFEVIST